ncbi:MAG: DUF169 domain-containing protein [Deltaproteobacteria bacterium]|nr:DUF169 domain-containing protein [Deltaproteobacteria bacterium]
MDLNKFQQAGKNLYHQLHLPTYPVAIKFIKSEDEIPEGVVRPTAMDQKWSLCQAYTYARRWGWHSAMTEKDNFCVPASAMHHWVDVTAEEFIQSQVNQGWHKDLQAEKNRYDFAMGIFKGPQGEKLLARVREYIGFICSPLPQTVVEPDTVMVYGDGSHIMHIIHALCYDYKQPVLSSFEGFGETCAKGGLIPFITGRPQVVIPGMGDRAFAGIADDEIAIGFPAGLLDEVLENMFKTGGEMNIGLPLKSLMAMGLNESITPGFGYLRKIVDEKKKK